ncbi:hypothetical protein LZ017_09290 [Pelomonas sp. CA6]|uniref:hypothetical protein n=1 Tax=Pelomonas sp. CA6 TaxID=2907999 RepID=UPI001F4C2354|nr:hypothetical protein [Pelomonas sp. CA6]MCH7343571.1 hypothetical protein [Pelomonas sp. CA6]
MPKMIVWRVFFASALCLATCAQAVTYQDPLNAKSSITIADRSVILVDVEKPAKRCGSADPYVCIKSQPFSLAVPKDSSISKWDFAGSRYEIVSKNERMILGTLYSYDIVKVSGTLNLQFAYSRKEGIIAIKEPSGNTLLPVEKCGILVQDTSGGCN